MILLGADQEVAAWVGKRVGVDCFGLCVGIGVARHGQLIAGAIYNNYRPPCVEVTFASDTPRWASKENISCILSYPFVQLGCLRVNAYTKANNSRARTFLTRLGFDQEGYHPHGFADDDAVSYGLLREKCRWLTPAHVEICSKSPDAG